MGNAENENIENMDDLNVKNNPFAKNESETEQETDETAAEETVASEIDSLKEQLEKVVWRKYLYTPSPESLFEATLAREISLIQKCDLDVKNAIIRGIEQSGILNARAIIKARPSLVAIASSTALRKQEIDHSERECALSKAIELAILVSANALPEVKESSDSMGKALIMIQLEGYEYLQEAFEPLTNGRIVNKTKSMNRSLGSLSQSTTGQSRISKSTMRFLS